MNTPDENTPDAGSHVVASDSEAPAEAVAEAPAEEMPPVVVTLQDFRDRVEKGFQLRGLAIPELTDEWLAEKMAEGMTAAEAFEILTA